MDEQPYDQSDLPSSSVPPPPLPANLPPGMTAPSLQAERPAAATVIGILLLIFAGFALMNLVQSVIGSTGHSSNPAYRMYPQWYWPLSSINCVIAFTCELLLGIGLLRMRSWARKWTIIWLICAPFLGFIVSGLALSHLNYAMFENSMPGATASMTAMIMKITVVVSIVLVLAINGLMIYFITRPNVVAAFDAKAIEN